MIPKIIHYVWIGPHKEPAIVQKCIQSWQQHNPTYAIMRWDETNSPMQHPFVAAMCKKKLWAFASDYIRTNALYEHGGIAIGADMEALRSFDPLLVHECFAGAGKTDAYVASGIVGAVPQHPAIEAMRNFYEHDTSYSIQNTAPVVLTSGIETCPSRITVLPTDMFYPCGAQEPCPAKKLQHAYTTNHWHESWRSYAHARKVLRWVAHRIGVYGACRRLLALWYSR